MIKRFLSIPFILFVIFLFAFFLRTYNIDTNLFFGPEQGRDLLEVRNIVLGHNLTLIGSKTDIDGIFHGPLYYYLAAIPFIFSSGNPLFIEIFFILLQSLGVFLMYALVKEFFQNKNLAVVAALMYAVSFEMIVFSRWLINVPLSIPFSMLFFYFFHRFLRGSRWNLVGVMTAFTLLGHSEFLNYLLFGMVLLICAFFYKNAIRKKGFAFCAVIFIIGLFFSVFHYLLFDLRHQFLITHSFIQLLSGQGGTSASLPDVIGSLWETFLHEWQNIVGVMNNLIATILALICFVIFFRQRNTKQNQFAKGIVGITFLSFIIVFIGARHALLNQFLVGILPILIIMIAVAIYFVFKKYPVIGLALIGAYVYIHVSLLAASISGNKGMFFQNPQPLLKYSDEMRIVNWVYKDTKGEPFSIQAFTIPYFWQDSWEYLFWYAGNTYCRQTPKKELSRLYVVIQDIPSNETFLKDWYNHTVSTWGEKIKSYKSGILTVELRKPKGL